MTNNSFIFSRENITKEDIQQVLSRQCLSLYDNTWNGEEVIKVWIPGLTLWSMAIGTVRLNDIIDLANKYCSYFDPIELGM